MSVICLPIFLYIASEVLGDPPRDPAQPPHQRVVGGGERKVNVPAQVCKFLVDSLQRHREVLCVLVRV